MGSTSPLAIEFSTQLDRMEKLLIAAGISSPAPTSSPLPAVHLDVAECYKQLNGLKNTCPEDIVMRQALELYCSLMSPPATPTSNFISSYQSQQDQVPEKVTSPERFHNQRDYEPCGIVYNLAPTVSNHGTSKELQRAFANNSQMGFYHAAHACNDYTCSTVSSVSDQDINDLDDMDDDPFASYPLSYPNRLAAYSQPGFKSQTEISQYRRVPAAAQVPTVQRHGSVHRPKTSGGTPAMTKASSVDVQYTRNQLASSQATHFNLNVQPSTESKPSGRKRAFSVVSLGKHRKALSGGSGTLRISAPLSASNTLSFTGTFSAQTQNHRPSGKRLSIMGCLSPAMEENEDINPFKSSPSYLARSSTSSSIERYQSMNISNKLSSRAESKSIWKSFKS